MKRKFNFLAILLILISSMSVTAETSSTSKITKVILVSDLQESFERIDTETLELIINKEDKRQQFADNLSTQKRMRERVKEVKLEESYLFKQAVYELKLKLYLDTLAKIEYDKVEANFEEIAKEVFDGNSEMFSIARKIKIAQIYIDKSKEGYKVKVEKVKKGLKESEHPDVEFHQLAKEYTDAKYEKEQLYAGYYDKWIIEPKKSNKIPAVLVAAFKLKDIGDISEAVESEKAVQFVKIMADTPSRPQEFAKVKEDIMKQEKSALWENKQNKILNSLRLSAEELNINDDLLVEQLKAELSKRKKEVKK